MGNPQRILALDSFMVITIASMVMVNQLGIWNYFYSQIRHSKWNGCTLTDLVFPFFLLIMGVDMWFSFQRNNQKLTLSVSQKIIRCYLVIFLIGLVLNLLNTFANRHAINISIFRLTGVFQRIEFCYGIGTIICLFMKSWQIAITSVIILIGYCLIIWRHGGIEPYSPMNNIVGKINVPLLGINRLSGGYAVDITGLFSSMPAVVNVLLEYLLDRMISIKTDIKGLVFTMFIVGIPVILLTEKWNYAFPINKTFWSSSYVLYTASWGIITRAFFIWLIDFKRNNIIEKINILGKNSG